MDGDIEFELMPQRRDYPRWDVDIAATVVFADGPVSCRLTDISATGASANLSPAPAMGTRCAIDVPTLGRLDAEVVRIDGTDIGFQFRIDEVKQEDLAGRIAAFAS